MGVRKFRAYLKWMKRALLQKFMIEIDGEQEEELTEALENGEGDQDAGYLAGFLKDVLDGASPTTWTPHPSSHNKKILDFLKDDVVGTPREATLWRRATLYNTFAKLQE